VFLHTGLWSIVNNAGIGYLAELEMTSEKLFRKVLDVNLLGMVNVTKTFLPLIRLAKGRIVNMSSVTGTLYILTYLYTFYCDFFGFVDIITIVVVDGVPLF